MFKICANEERISIHDIEMICSFAPKDSLVLQKYLIYNRMYDKYANLVNEEIYRMDEITANVISFKELDKVRNLVPGAAIIKVSPRGTMVLIKKNLNKVLSLLEEGYVFTLGEEVNQVVHLIKNYIDLFVIEGYYPSMTLQVSTLELPGCRTLPEYPYRYTRVTDSIRYSIIDAKGKVLVNRKPILSDTKTVVF